MKQTLRLLAATAAAGALALTACGTPDTAPAADETSGQAISVAHTQGTAELDGTPSKIVVLDFGALDTLDALGVSGSVVGVPKGGAFPDAVSSFNTDSTTDVGTLQEPNFEVIASLQPDLIVAGFRSAKQVPELSKIAPTIDITYDYSKSFYDGVAYATDILAEATGTQEQAEAELKELEEAIAAAKDKVPAGKNAMVLMTSGGKVSAHGTQSRYNALFNDLGIEPTISDVEAEAHGDAISFEAIQQANPDLLFVVDRDAAIGEEGAAAEQVLDNELVATTSAWSNDDVVYLEGQRWYILIHGANNAVEMINQVAAEL
ncbi:ABC transporter substrate-binding protein [Tessaracoccus sp. MC1865]|uniref:siderophore ABC transporter substrate-binding protein n=1 Tax=Tessaracoccus sp. MC1865 TaxID=2760310 RepID=UPI00160240D7|nr:ABC transporter substrate-binding protein [Tessaracoccus sp. MC1865]MBB1482358.1 ABC transporter substrate-binding protein [Tessaracoccus sp. MC1865]QTO38174.1 ABC transporter substrate-binding protein [Tessaracoccus sp. MC1865]